MIITFINIILYHYTIVPLLLYIIITIIFFYVGQCVTYNIYSIIKENRKIAKYEKIHTVGNYRQNQAVAYKTCARAMRHTFITKQHTTLIYEARIYIERMYSAVNESMRTAGDLYTVCGTKFVQEHWFLLDAQIMGLVLCVVLYTLY